MGPWPGTTNAEAYVTPEPERSGGFLNWLSGNYAGVTGSIRDIACIFRPETCAGGNSGQPPVIIQQDDSATKNYLLILGVLILLVLIVLLVKK